MRKIGGLQGKNVSKIWRKKLKLKWQCHKSDSSLANTARLLASILSLQALKENNNFNIWAIFQ